MSLAIYSSAAFSNASGLAVAAGAAVEVRRESDAALAAIFEDRAGATQITQPGFAADASGRFTFFAAGNETYRVTVDDGTESFTLRYQACGNAAERDVGVAGGVASFDALADRGAAAWIKFNMATDAIAASFNVSSITDGSLGRDTIVWDTDFISADYTVVASGMEANVDLDAVAGEFYAASQCSILCRNLSNIDTDGTLVSVVAFGAQV
jgi:hypothetical protein